MSTKPDPQWHREQIAAYAKSLPAWKEYADALRRVLQAACKSAVPEALVQAREKSVASFAEKCVRKWDRTKELAGQKHKNPATDFTDLCGARVIVHTLEQVSSVRAFIEGNFTVVERDDKGAALGVDKFGYRDMHFLVQLKADREWENGFTPEERERIGKRTAELQIRTVVQHAWADILHDRLYKAPLKLSAEAKRTGALLAAIMEDGDRSFSRLAGELDGMAANYTAYATSAHVKAEIEVEELILANTEKIENRVPNALRLARLLAPLGRYADIVKMLDPLRDVASPLRMELRLELGHALCRMHKDAAQSAEHRRGCELLDEVVADSESTDFTEVPNLNRRKALLARALSRRALAWEAVRNKEAEALNDYRRALEAEPGNPYHLANQLAFEIFCSRNATVPEAMGTQIRTAVAKCREHAVAGTELPFAHFTAGRLSLLLRDGNGALGWYARGLRHLFDEQSCVSESALDDELEWIARLHFGAHPPKELQWVTRLIGLARAFHAERESKRGVKIRRVLIVAGGAASMPQDVLARVQPLVEAALRHFSGTVISGGTSVGVPGCVGEAAAKLLGEGRKKFEAIGYIPRKLPKDAPWDTRYDRPVETDDEDFSPGQILTMWENLRDEGIPPSCVQLLGIGGGPLTGVEFRVALALGASTAAVHCTGGAADALLNDEAWRNTPLLGLPHDIASVQAFVSAPVQIHADGEVEKMALAFHENYREIGAGSLPENMRPWTDLRDTYKDANRAQAANAEEILHAAGFRVRPVGSPGTELEFAL